MTIRNIHRIDDSTTEIDLYTCGDRVIIENYEISWNDDGNSIKEEKGFIVLDKNTLKQFIKTLKVVQKELQ